MLSAGALPNQANFKSGRTPLLTALDKGHLDVARALLVAGSNPDKADLQGLTPRKINPEFVRKAVRDKLFQAAEKRRR